MFDSRLAEAFVSIQLEKVSLRDEMLNSFVKKSQAARGVATTAVSGARRTSSRGRQPAMKCVSKFLSHHRRKWQLSDKASSSTLSGSRSSKTTFSSPFFEKKIYWRDNVSTACFQQIQRADVTALRESTDCSVLLQPELPVGRLPVCPSLPLHDWTSQRWKRFGPGS